MKRKSKIGKLWHYEKKKVDKALEKPQNVEHNSIILPNFHPIPSPKVKDRREV